MNREPTTSDRLVLCRCAGLLEVIGRSSTTSTVALHCLMAAQLLSHAGIQAATRSAQTAGDQDALSTVLAELDSVSSHAFRDDDLLDAVDHVLLAHLAVR